MPCRTLVPAVALAALSVFGMSASSGRMPVDEIRPGMVGVGRTVFEGNRIEEFKVHFIGVLRNVLGPSRNLILARLEGGPLASTGVIAGMSGSPVYVDGRIVGAVSYSLGAFSKEPIAGITPIDEMIEAAARTRRRQPLLRAELELPVTQASLAAALRPLLRRQPPVRRVARRRRGALVGRVGASTRTSDPMLRPISTPLVLGGFGGEVAELLAGAFREAGFTPMTGMGGDARTIPRATRPLAPGDAVGVSLIEGDLVAWRHGHRDARRGRPRLCVRAPLLQPRADRVPHDAGVRAHAAAEPHGVREARDDGRRDRDVPAGSRRDDCRRARRRALAHPHHRRARHRARTEAHLQVRGGARSALHAGARLCLGAQHAEVVRARVRRRHLHGEGPDAHPEARGGQPRRPVHGRVAVGRRGHATSRRRSRSC